MGETDMLRGQCNTESGQLRETIVDNYLKENPDYIKRWLTRNLKPSQLNPWIESLKVNQDQDSVNSSSSNNSKGNNSRSSHKQETQVKPSSLHSTLILQQPTSTSTSSTSSPAASIITTGSSSSVDPSVTLISNLSTPPLPLTSDSASASASCQQYQPKETHSCNSEEDNKSNSNDNNNNNNNNNDNGNNVSSNNKDEDDTFLAESYIEMTKQGRNSVTSELFQDILEGTRKSHRPSLNISEADQLSRNELREQLRNLSEEDLLMELIRDISNELDINTLCHKILVNVCILIKSDRGSLFLARGSREKRYLVPKLFDVTPSSILEDALSAAEQYVKVSPPIPFGRGIAGYVAQHKDFINLKNAYEDPRFNKEVDSVTGYRTKSILCLPILNGRGDVIGVAQCINKLPDGSGFSSQDVEDFKKYLTFCGIGIQNAQLFELSVQEYKRNQLLLNLARSIFEETSSLEALINKIMIQAQGLLPCEKSRVYLVDIDSQEENQSQHFSSIFESQLEYENATKLIADQTSSSRCNDIYAKLAHKVLLSGQTSNRNCIKNCDDCMEVDIMDGINIVQQIKGAKSILSIPILNCDGVVIGVAQMINKTNGDLFSDVDISTLEAFSIFCGLGIHKTQMYEKAIKLMAKQKVALEVLSYHASSTIEEAAHLIEMKVESVQHYGLNSFDFNDFNLSEMDTCLATLRMFMELGFINRFHIPYKILCRWILSVKKNYRPVIYHNWRHSFNVTQTMFAILTIGQMSRIMTELDSLALIVACLCHDLDHRGTNNSFQSKIDSPLATLYSTSTMEHHHFDQCIMILNSEGNNILQALSPEEYKMVVSMIESCILSTDLAQYFNKRGKFSELVSDQSTDWTQEANKKILAGMLMTACDVSAIAKPWSVQERIAQLVADEFFQQGDYEKSQLNSQPMPMMDRDRKHEFPGMQVTFIDTICLPIYQILSDFCPSLEPLYEGCLANRSRWMAIQSMNE